MEFGQGVVGLEPDEFRGGLFERFEFAEAQEQIALHGKEPGLRWHGFEVGVDSVQGGDILFAGDHSIDILHLGKMLVAFAKLDFFAIAARAQTVLIERSHERTVICC